MKIRKLLISTLSAFSVMLASNAQGLTFVKIDSGKVDQIAAGEKVQAGRLQNVRHIEITNALGTWLQISELTATGSNDNAISLTNNASVSATSVYSNSSIYAASRALDGSGLSFYHGGSSKGDDVFKISFNTETSLNSFSLRSRYNNSGANSRDVYNVVFKDKDGNVLHELKNWDGRIANNDMAKQNNGLITTNFAEVPIPAAALLFAPALLGFMGLRRKIKAKASV